MQRARRAVWVCVKIAIRSLECQRITLDLVMKSAVRTGSYPCGTHPLLSSYLVNPTDTRRFSGAYPTILLRGFSSSNEGVAATENKIDEIVNAFGEEMERIVFNSNGKAKTMDLAKAWLRARLKELIEEMRAEFPHSDLTNIMKEGLSHNSSTILD
jgi:hypothetical protein